MDIIHKMVIYYLSLIVYTGVLIWGLKLIHRAISEPGALLALMCEKTVSEPVNSPVESAAGAQVPPPSFSRLSGAVGAMGIAAMFIGIGYWVIYSLFNGGNLSELEGLGTYFLSGTALFAPYAFNKLTTIFK